MEFFKRANQRSDLANKQNEELQIEFENELRRNFSQLEFGQNQFSVDLDDQEKLNLLKSLKNSIQKKEGIQRGYVKDPLNRD